MVVECIGFVAQRHPVPPTPELESIAEPKSFGGEPIFVDCCCNALDRRSEMVCIKMHRAHDSPPIFAKCISLSCRQALGANNHL